jgi:predicted dehydrogenase
VVNEDEYVRHSCILSILSVCIKAYAVYAKSHPEKCKITAIAEPRTKARDSMAREYNINDKYAFGSWKDFLSASEESIANTKTRLTDAVLITVQDHLHAELVEAFAAQGYHILCEKPMATSIEHCLRMEESVKKAGVIFGMGHGMPFSVYSIYASDIYTLIIVLRYSPYNLALSRIVQSGQLGELVNIVHIEPVGHTHFSHSYVRGNWSREKDSSFSLMTKSCQ